jgi:hypothetical protein
MTTMPDEAGPLTAELDAIEARNEQAESPSADIRRLLALASVLLDGHVPVPLYGPVEDEDGGVICGHDLDEPCHFETDGGEFLCREWPAGFACGWCRENLLDEREADWPCPIWRDAFEALTGEKTSTEEGRGE